MNTFVVLVLAAISILWPKSGNVAGGEYVHVKWESYPAKCAYVEVYILEGEGVTDDGLARADCNAYDIGLIGKWPGAHVDKMQITFYDRNHSPLYTKTWGWGLDPITWVNKH